MKRNFIIAVLLLIALPLGLKAQDKVVIDQVVGVVGKHIVKLSDIENSYIPIRMKQGYSNPFENRCQILEDMLITKLLIHKGEQDSIEVTDDDVEMQVQYILRMLESQYGGKEGIKKATDHAYDELHDLYFNMYRDRLMAQKAEYKLTENVKVTPSEVAAYYNNIPKDSLPVVPEQFELAEITIHPIVTEAERDNAREQLARLRERVLNGEKFSMLATLYSQDPESAKKGGELGFFGRDMMVPEFEAAAFALKPGEVSPIIETQFGFHIIQLIERRGNTINARHILITPKVSIEDQLSARMKLDSIANQIKLGNLTFAQAAEKFSDGPTKKQGGVVYKQYTGDMRFTKDECSQQFPGIGFAAMNAGDVSNATEMQTEENKTVYRLMQVTKRIPEHQANLTDDYDNIFNAALSEAKHKKVMEWSAKMLKNTYVRISPEFRDCSFQLPWVKYSAQ
ncbi:MAG: peptidylprolyl isomerase [Bacteroidales bacterium]|nr:peptidylprolyl isomerase [Bacteroidales bacterium]